MTGHNCTGDGCDLCAALSHTDLGQLLANDEAQGEPELVLVPRQVLEEMQRIVNRQHAVSAEFTDWASLSAILDSVLP